MKVLYFSKKNYEKNTSKCKFSKFDKNGIKTRSKTYFDMTTEVN